MRSFSGLLRGVELFNFSLLRELVQEDVHVCMCVHRSWVGTMRAVLPESLQEKLEIIQVSSNPIGMLFSLSKLAHQRFNVVLVGNVANSLIVVLNVLRMMGVAERCVLIAHRRPTRKFMHAQKLWRTIVVAVNRIIAEDFRRAGFTDVEVYYGIINADRFYPQEAHIHNERVNFCVLGYLDSPWKGVDTAVNAFRAMPEQIRKESVLHLASFSHPPSFPENNIKTYSWLVPDTIPDFLRTMDVMIVPSRDEKVMRETFSQAMVQGMLTGLPIVVNNLPVLTEKIDCGGGLVFNNIAELTEIMILLVENPEIRNRLGRLARKVAVEQYVWDTKFFMEHYLQLAQQGHHRYDS